jgi:flagellar protein FliO/FliZ
VDRGLQMLWRSLALLASCIATTARAAPTFAVPEAASTVATPGVGSISQVVFALAVILALIFGFAWLTRRVRGFQSGGASIDVLAQASVGQKERVVLLSVSGRRLLIGVASGAVTTLHTFEPGESPLEAPVIPGDASVTTEGSVAVRFRDILQRSLGTK